MDAESIIGKYSIYPQILGKSAFADVKLAIHPKTNTAVAVKVFNLSNISRFNEYLTKHFKREAEILPKLDHPGIIKLFEVHQTSTHYYLFLELGDKNMVYFINNNRFLPNKKIYESMGKYIGRQLVSAVAHMHSRGFVHRDIKMENILINPETRRIKIIDFDLSSIYDPNSFMTTYCGSPQYSAPEQLQAKGYTSKVDIWSMGVVFFAMMAGELPFRIPNHRGMRGIGMSFKTQKNIMISMNANGIKTAECQKMLCGRSSEFLSLIDHMLEPNPEERYDIHQVEQHCWFDNPHQDQEEQLPEFDDNQKSKEIQKVAEYFEVPYTTVEKHIKDELFDPIHGMFNIQKYNFHYPSENDRIALVHYDSI